MLHGLFVTAELLVYFGSCLCEDIGHHLNVSWSKYIILKHNIMLQRESCKFEQSEVLLFLPSLSV